MVGERASARMERLPKARGPELHPALEPADRLAHGQGRRRGVDQRVVRKRLVAGISRIECPSDLIQAECGAEEGSVHGVFFAR